MARLLYHLNTKLSIYSTRVVQFAACPCMSTCARCVADIAIYELETGK